MKICARCGESKPLDDFNRNKKAANGRQSHCRPCQTIIRREWARNNPQRRRETLRRQYRREIEIGYRQSKKSSKEQKAAHYLVERAIKSGELVRPNICEACLSSVSKIHGHHDNYSKPLDVKWLCPPCHGAVHAGRIAE